MKFVENILDEWDLSFLGDQSGGGRPAMSTDAHMEGKDNIYSVC